MPGQRIEIVHGGGIEVERRPTLLPDAADRRCPVRRPAGLADDQLLTVDRACAPRTFRASTSAGSTPPAAAMASATRAPAASFTSPGRRTFPATSTTTSGSCAGDRRRGASGSFGTATRTATAGLRAAAGRADDDHATARPRPTAASKAPRPPAPERRARPDQGGHRAAQEAAGRVGNREAAPSGRSASAGPASSAASIEAARSPSAGRRHIGGHAGKL